MAYDQITADLVRENWVLRERVAELEAALKPFAAKATTVHRTILDNVGLQYPVHGATVGDLRRAATLLSGGGDADRN